MNKIIKKIHMGDLTHIRSDIAIDIKNGKMGKRQLQKIILKLKNDEVGRELFVNNIVFQINNDKSMWTDDYLRNIGEAISCGDLSEELLYHMLDVSRYVNRAYRYVGFVCIIVIMLLVVVVINKVRR